MANVFLKAEVVKSLRAETGTSLKLCSDAYDYAKGDRKIALAYIKAKTLAVCTPGMTFDQRVQMFATTA